MRHRLLLLLIAGSVSTRCYVPSCRSAGESGDSQTWPPPQHNRIQPLPDAAGTNHGTAMPWQLTFAPLMFAMSHPFCLIVPSIVTPAPEPPSLTAFELKVLLAALAVPDARAINFMLSHEIMPVRALLAPTTRCQSNSGQPAWAFEWKA